MLPVSLAAPVFLAMLAVDASASIAAKVNCAPEQRVWSAFRRDIDGLVSKETASIIAAGFLASAATHVFDDEIDRWAEAKGPSAFTRVGEVSGKTTWQIPVVVGALAAGRFEDPACLSAFGSDLARATVINVALTQALKFTVRRDRPNHRNRQSFPSGHASSTFAMAAVVQRHYGWRAGGPVYAFAAYTAWSRLRDNQHWFSDVVAGAALGVAIGRAVSRPSRERASSAEGRAAMGYVTPDAPLVGFAVGW